MENQSAGLFNDINSGNIDVTKIQPISNSDGSVSTVRSISFNEDGKEILIPTVVNGKIVSNDEAIAQYHKTGSNLGKFNTVEEADQYAESLHNSEEKRVDAMGNNSVQKGQENISLGGKIESLVTQADVQIQQRKSLGIPISDQQWNLISKSASSAEKPDEEMQRYAAALTYSREYGVDISTAFQNLDQFNAYQLGTPYSPTPSNTQAIVNSFKAGKLGIPFAELALKFKNADLAGEDTSQILSQMQSMQKEIDAYQDNIPRNLATSMLKNFAYSSPYTFDVAGHSLAGGTASALALATIAAASGLTFATGGLATPMAATVIPASLATVYAGASTAFTFQRSKDLQEGIAYYNMVSNGADKQIASNLSLIDGSITGAVEAVFDQIGGFVLKGAGKNNAVRAITSKVMGKLVSGGVLGTIATGIAGQLADATGEGLQEFTESIADQLTEQIAYSMSDVVPPQKSTPIIKQAIQEGIGGFEVGLLMGSVPSSLNTAMDIKQMANIKKSASSIPSKEAFISEMKENKPESVSSQDWTSAMDSVWIKEHEGKSVSTAIQSEESAVNELDAGKGKIPSGYAKRLSSGELFTQEGENITTDTEGNEHHQLKIGDPVNGKRYGTIDYALTGNTLTVEDIRVRSGYEQIRKESLLSLAKQYPGYDIQWEAKGENLQAIKNEIIESNPRGKESGLQYYDGITNVDERIVVEKTIGVNFPNLNASERSAAAILLQLRAEAKGMTSENYIKSVSSNGSLFSSLSSEKLGNAKAKGVTSFDQDAKAIIYATEKADFSSFSHELFHVIRREMDQTTQLEQALSEASVTPEFEKYIQDHKTIFNDSLLGDMSPKQISNILGQFGQTWTRVQEEATARLWESYLKDGKTTSKKLEGIFQRIAQWMGKIYNTLKGSVSIDPRISEVFDSLLDADTPLAKTARETTNKDVLPAGTERINQKSILFQENRNESQRQYNAVVSKLRNTKQWLKAPNGKATNLNERQWVQVHTPAFLSWFGDWINDPSNASKVIDENGEPLVVYHYTSEKFNTFDVSKSRQNMDIPGFYFSNEKTNWQDMGKNLIGAFLDIKNPIEEKPIAKGDGRTVRAQMISDGYDGAITIDEEIEETEYLALSPNQIKSATENNGQFSDDNASILFQEYSINDQILDDARQSDTWQDFKDFYAAFADPEDKSIPSDDAWYREKFNEAHEINNETITEQEPQTTRIKLETEEQKDDFFRNKMQTDKGITDFISKIGWILTTHDYEHNGPGDQAEADYANLVYEKRLTLPDEVHPTVLANAYRISGGKSLSQKSIKSLRTLITGDPIRYYRDIYADIFEDKDLKPQVIDERLPKIDEPGFEEIEQMNITQRINLAKDIEGAELKKKILSGKETMSGDAEKVIAMMDREISDLNKQIDLTEKDIANNREKLTDAEKTLSILYEDWTDTRSKLDKELSDIRKKTDEGYRIPKESVDSTYKLQKRIDLLHEQIIKMRASERVKATVKRHEALNALKEQLREKQKAKDEARKVREYKQKLARQIMVKPSDAIDYAYSQKIYNLQATLDPKFRQTSVEIEGERVTIDEARQIMEGVSDEEMRDALGDRLYSRLKNDRKPLNDWTIEEMEQLAETIANLRSQGRQVLESKNEQKRIVAQSYQDAIIRSVLASGKYIPRPIYGSKEDLEQRRSPRDKYRDFRYTTLPMRVKAMMLDGNKQNAAYDLLITQKRNNQNIEWNNIEKRQKPIFDLMKSLGITEKDLYKTVPVTLDGEVHRMTYSTLMYAWLSQFEESNRQAISYGSLVTVDDKIQLNHDNELIKTIGDARYRQLLDHAQHYLVNMDESGKYMALVKAIQNDFNGQADRINEIAIREYNQPMRAVDEYLPIHRKEMTGNDLKQNVADDWFNSNAGGMATSVSKGFTKNRINISPDHQGNTDMDLMNVWDRSVRQQEHMIAFAEYGRKLNRVFKNLGSRETQNIINQTYGSSMMEDINDYIDEVMNPQSFERKAGAEKMIKSMRGNLGAAYLAWKISGLVLQAITSPMPFLSDVNAGNLIQGYFDISTHPYKVWEFVQEKSTMMKNRSPNIIIDQILQESRTYTDNKLRKINTKQQELGTMGLTLVDRWAVAGGWLAAYRQKLAELENKGYVSSDADAQAIVYADDVVLRTQPTGDKTELSPLFKAGGEFGRAFTQFQTALNVIWANTTYDVPNMIKDSMNKNIPESVRKAQFKRAVGQVAGYVLAGALLGAVAEGHGKDDDNKRKARNVLYWSLTQFADSVPLVGQSIDEIVKSLITGEKPAFYGSDIFPALSSILDGMVDITQGDWEKSLKNLSEGFGYATGAPVSGIKQVNRAIKEGAGAFLGRRK